MERNLKTVWPDGLRLLPTEHCLILFHHLQLVHAGDHPVHGHYVEPNQQFCQLSNMMGGDRVLLVRGFEGQDFLTMQIVCPGDSR